MRGEEQLREELHEFQQEKERIRNIVGQIGGVNSNQNKVINTLLILIIMVLLILGGVFKKISPSLAVQVAILFGVIKLIWMFYESQRASHFQFWILNSLEFRINEMYKKTKTIEKELKELKKQREQEENDK